MPFPCSKCNRTLSVWDLHRIVEYTKNIFGHKIKLDRDICTECLGWGLNENSNPTKENTKKTI